MADDVAPSAGQRQPVRFARRPAHENLKCTWRRPWLAGRQVLISGHRDQVFKALSGMGALGRIAVEK